MRNKKLAAVLSGVFLCLIAGYWLTRPGEIRIDENAYYKVDRSIDGDTFTTHVEGRLITVRMLGIDTPETVDPRKPAQCYGPEASDASKNLLTGRSVRFAINPNRELKDRYGRYLLYVYRDDGLFVNRELIRRGFAKEYTFGKPYAMQAEFREIESEAMKGMKGLWDKCKQP